VSANSIALWIKAFREYGELNKNEETRREAEALRFRGCGNMDISATRGSENVAIEIETGKSDVVSNVKRNLLSGFQKVIVVATDRQALKKVERQLAKESLLIPERVEVVPGDSIVLAPLK
jgi:predicted RecB family endonuclease